MVNIGKRKEGDNLDSKYDRSMAILFRGLRGENLSAKRLSEEYGVSPKSISRSINDLKAFLADHRDLVGHSELRYSNQDKSYHLYIDEFLTSKELLSLLEVLIGTRAFSKIELLAIVDKLKRFTTAEDRKLISDIITKELYHYSEVKHDCDSVQDTLWKLVNNIRDRHEISIDYYRTNRDFVTHRLRPATVMFSDFYFYLIAFPIDGDTAKPLYFRIDRIKNITVHRKTFTTADAPEYDEGLLQQRSLLMWPGKLRTIRFEYTGPSVQAVLDKLPTAKIIDRSDGKYLIEAEVYGDGIKMWLLSQGMWVKVVAPEEFTEEIKVELNKMWLNYE